MKQYPSITVTIPNPTSGQMIAINNLLEAAEQNAHAQEAAAKKGKGKSKPEPTVDEEEDEDFGGEELDEEDLDEGDEEEEEKPKKKKAKAAPKSKDVDTDDDAEESEEDEEGDDNADETEEPSVSFAEVKAALNKYGEKFPDQARAILKGFKIAGPKELAATKNQKHYEAIYRKVMAKLKEMKKKGK